MFTLSVVGGFMGVFALLDYLEFLAEDFHLNLLIHLRFDVFIRYSRPVINHMDMLCICLIHAHNNLQRRPNQRRHFFSLPNMQIIPHSFPRPCHSRSHLKVQTHLRFKDLIAVLSKRRHMNTLRQYQVPCFIAKRHAVLEFEH